MKYFAIESLDGGGKDTQIEMIKETFGTRVKYLREPTDHIRESVQREAYKSPVARSLELMADRAELYTTLGDGLYTSNRSIISGYGYTRGIPLKVYRSISESISKPVVTGAVLLYMSKTLFVERNINKNKDAIESRPVGWHMKTQQRMLDYIMAEGISCLILDAALDKQYLHTRIINFMDDLL